MSHARVPILDTILKSWTDAFRAIRAMPLVGACGLVLHTLIVTSAFFAAGSILMHHGRSVQEWTASPAWFVFTVFNAAIRVVLLAPLFIAIHRYVIRGECARGYPLNPLRPSYTRYVGAALLALIAFRLPELMGVWLAWARQFMLFDLAFLLLAYATMLTVAVIVLGKITAFPAIAVGAPKANWLNTELPSVSQLMRMIAVLIGVVAPAQLAGWLLQAYVPAPFWPNGNGNIVPTLARVLVDFPALCALAAAMSRLYLVTATQSVGTVSAAADGHPATA
jgi:hypothetical protein